MDIILYILISSHLVILGMSLWAHRGLTHKAVEFHPALAHLIRFWMWAVAAFPTKAWVAIHRKHHAHSDQPQDPHSPAVFGFWKVMFGSPVLIEKAAQDCSLVDALGKDVPNDWIEENVYGPHRFVGLGAFLLINICVLGWWGILAVLIISILTPLLGSGLLNAVGHRVGYRNHDTKDNSTNMFPIGIIIAGEELHNNHHKHPASAKLSEKWYEFDLGWMYLSILKRLGLVKLKN